MKKILFLLLATTTISTYAQVGTGQEQEFDYGIKNNSASIVPTPNYLTTSSATGVYGKIEPINLQISTATQNALDAKQIVFTGIDQAQFLTENDIVIDNTALTLTIATVKNGGVISTNNPVIFYTDGNGVAVRRVKTSPVVFTFTNTTGIWYFYFDSSGNPIATQTSPTDSSTIARVYRIYWNSTLAIADKRVIESLEVYKNDATWIDRDWKDTQGAQYSSGFTLTSNVLASGTPAIDGSNAVINLTSGTILDSNLAYTLTNASTGTTKFTQNLGSGLLPATSGKFITITNNASLVLDKIPATDFPFLWNATSNTPEYLTQLGVRTGVTANNFFVYYLYAIQDPRRGETIKIKSAEIDFANSSLAEAHSWTQLQTLFPTLRDSKIRVLYKLTFEYKTAFDIGTKKSALRKIEDLRKQRTTSTATVGGVIPASTVSFTAAGNISSTNVQLALEELDIEKAPLASPALTGTPTAPTAGLGTNTTQLATTAFVFANAQPLIPHLGYDNTNQTLWNYGKGGVDTNSSFGNRALNVNTTGFENVAYGLYSLGSNTTGNGNVAFGNRAGNQSNSPDVNGFQNQFSTNSVFIGNWTSAKNNNTANTNEIVIGDRTLGAGSNTATLGNTSIITTRLRGAVQGGSFVKDGGTSSQFLKADGSSDGTDYATSTGGTGYIQNQNASAQSANMWISGEGKFNGDLYLNRSGLVASAPLKYGTNNVDNWFIGQSPLGTSTNDLSWYSYGTNSTVLNLNHSTGAATFASTITASNGTLIGGSLTSGYIPRTTGTNSLGNSLIYDDGTNVGIGTATPSQKLSVSGNISLDTGGYIYGNSTTPYLRLSQENGSFLGYANSGIGLYGSLADVYATDNITFRTNSTERVNVSSSGVLKINNLSGTGTRTVVADASGNLSTIGVGYKVYTAYITQTGTAAPVATVFDNTLGGTVVWTRNSTGNYSGTLTGAFATGTYLNVSNTDPLANSGAFKNTSSEVKYSTTASGVLSDGVFVHLEIRVYN